MASPSDWSDLLSSLQVDSKSWSAFNWDSKAIQWDSTAVQSKEAREQSLAARKQLAETTKQFKKSVKNVEQAGLSLGSSNTDDNAADTVKAIELLAKNCRQTVKSYQGKSRFCIGCGFGMDASFIVTYVVTPCALSTEEIDNLTRRCKSSENSFTSLAQSLGENHDPHIVLSTAMKLVNNQQLQISQLSRSVEDLNKEKVALEKNSTKREVSKQDSSLSKAEKEDLMQLRREVAEYEVEFRSLKNQDITIRKLEARIVELQTGGEEEFELKLEKAREELAETEGRRTAEALEREAAMERKVQTLELQLKAERAGRAATQAHILEASEGVGEREAAWEAQRRILVDDAERVRVDLYEATRERDELRLKVGALEGGKVKLKSAPASGGIQMADLLSERQAYEAEVSELADTVNLLREDMSVNYEAFSDEKRSLQSKIDAIELEANSLKSNLSSLEGQLAEAPSQSLIDSMKRELRILKRLEYNADDPDIADRDPEMTGTGEGHEKDLESVLVAKLRRVESELVKERNQKADVGNECEQLRQEVSALEMAKTEAEKVVASLEADLDKAISRSSTQSPSKPRSKESLPKIAGENPATLQQVLDPDALEAPLPQSATPDEMSETSAAEKEADDHSVATIIMAQRDRLRTRCDALEAERDSFKHELQAQVDAAESLTTDNTKLYEKMRYLQSYKGNSGARGSYNRSNSRDLDLEALEQRYEASVDPFRQFGRAERQRKLNEMSSMERTVFVVAKTMLGSKEMRAFLFFYVFAMHFLVFLTTYHWSHSEVGSGCSIQEIENLAHLPPMTHKSPEEVMKDLSGK
jgi:homeobox protein cut-like